jgi:NADP-dependent 3-hydroxy acid dehydrogenase YdfG
MKASKKVVLKTGASSGMGRATALFLAEHNFIVYAGSRTPDKLKEIHPNINPIKLDVTNPENIKKQLNKLKI